MALKCRELPDKASAYIDREDSLKERLRIAWHLSRCPNCRTYVRGLRTARKLAAASVRAESPSYLDVLLRGGGRNRGEAGKD